MRVDWTRYRARLNTIGRSRWDRGIRAEPGWGEGRRIRDQDLWFIWTGQGKIRLRSGWADLHPGLCLWLRPGWGYAVKQNPNNPLGMNFIHFDLVDAHRHKRSPDAGLPPEIIEPPDTQLAQVATRRMVEICFGFQDKGFSAPPFPGATRRISETLLTVLLMELDAATDKTARTEKNKLALDRAHLIRQLALRIREHPQRKLSVTEMARECGYSLFHFTRTFKAIAGESPELYAVHCRLARARRLLRETNLSIGQVAAAAGYRDIYFFSRQFKQFIGRPPSQDRNHENCWKKALRG